MTKIINRLFTLILLFLISGAAWASDFTAGTAVADHTDLSVGYLGQVFGTVGNVLQGSSGQMLGQLFYKFNEGIIIIAGLWLAYTVFTIVLRSAQEGSFMGANKNVALVFLKIAVGFSLLVPNPATGYSLLQDLVMQVVVQGVGLADQTWAYGLTYINHGGSVWHRPEKSGDGGSIISDNTAKQILGYPTSDNKGTNKPGQIIFADEVCMYSSQDNQNQVTQNSTNIGPAVWGTPRVQYDVVTDDANHQFEFPGVGNAAPIGPGSQNCGSVSWDIQSACTGSGSSDIKCTMAKQALNELVMGLQPAAKKYYCSQHSSAPSCMGVATNSAASDNEQLFFSSLVNYVNIMVPLVQLNTKVAGNNPTNFIQQAISEGWLSAGRYYWDLAQVASRYDSVSSVDNYIPTAQGPVASVSGQPLTDYTNAKQVVSDTYIGSNPPASGTVLDILQTYGQTQGAGNTGSGMPLGAGGAHGILASIVGGPITDIVYLVHMFSTAGNGGWMGPDPILFLHRVGMSCIGIAADIWFGWLAIMVVMFLATGVCTSEFNSQPALQSVIDWVKPLMVILAGAFWSAGFVLGFYVPMYPYIIYTFGVIGWIIAVIEAMVAAPLVCFGLTHPEGHDFLGEAKQAAMLLLGVFLRPALMVIGLIAAMILSYVSLRILVYTFSGFATDLFGTASSSGAASGNVLAAAGTLMWNAMADSTSFSGFILCLLVFPMVLVVFTILVYTVTTQCFSLIFALPDNILRWIGGPMHQSQAAQMAQQVQSAMGGATGAIGQGVRASKDEAQRKKDLEKASQIALGSVPGGGGGPAPPPGGGV